MARLKQRAELRKCHGGKGDLVMSLERKTAGVSAASEGDPIFQIELGLRTYFREWVARNNTFFYGMQGEAKLYGWDTALHLEHSI